MRSASLHVLLLLAVFVAVAALAASGPIASASIMSTSGAITEIAPPPSVAGDALESDTTMFVFQEQHDFVLPVAAAVDITTPGDFIEANIVPGNIAQGSVVNIFYVNFDTVGTGNPGTILDATIVFEFPIHGIDLEPLLSEGLVFGAVGTTYADEGKINLTQGVENDVLGLAGDRRTLDIQLWVGGGDIDSMRIFTAVPEPSTLTLAGLGMIGLLAYGRRRRRRA